MRSDDALLVDMLVAARKIMRFMQNMSESDFLGNEMLQSAVMRELTIIGEAARMISSDARTTHDTIPWHLIAGMRNRLIHAYFDVRLDVVWETTQVDIPTILSVLEAIIPPDDDTMTE